MLSAIAHSDDPEVSALVRERILSSEIRDNEVVDIFDSQMGRAGNRAALWQWSKANLEPLLERFPSWRKGTAPALFSDFCSEEDAADLEATFQPIINDLESGPRYLANTLETIRLCASFVDLHRDELTGS